ncbi:SDR family NAD(P)-dependent oxidoreductase [Glycomyces sp. YM15]|uniref:SDR family NAD(P)-dependent oxidoreductase n=1 Tax=Glycomyces sp. YM15 TaxID=2800446 RepID=UPI0019645F52|nr:SDR family oxidoreductase [Glycomyces sp. YM15]
MTRTVVVSGGGTGIGLAVASRFTDDNVILVGRREDVLASAAAGIGARATFVAADLATVEGAERVAAFAAEHYGSVDVIAACAGGIAASTGDGLAAASRAWLDNLRLNVMTAVHLVEALKPHLNDDGRILLYSSIAAYRGSGNGYYGASKAALHPYAIDLAAELGPKRITANVIAPGYIEDTEFFGDRMTETRRARLIGQTVTGRAGNPGDIADLSHWLAAPEAGHVTAQIVQSNGGALAGR